MTGQKVWITTEVTTGAVVRPANANKTYVVEAESGFLRRNRSRMRPIWTITRFGQVVRPPERLDLLFMNAYMPMFNMLL